MRHRLLAALTAACVGTLLLAPLASAQVSRERIKEIDANLQKYVKLYNSMPAAKQQAVDAGGNMAQLANFIHKYGERLASPSFQNRFSSFADNTSAALPNNPGNGVAAVSNPSNDFAFSSFGGFTQSETSTARCGNSVVSTFNDSGSFFETLSGTGGLDFSGFGFSTDGGQTFKDGGFFPPGSNTNNFGAGDPVVHCVNANNFFYSELFETTDSAGNPISGVALRKSTDGGASWSDPILAIGKDGFTHLLDKDWSAVDPSKHSRLYVSYTDFDFSGTSPACGAQARIGIEFVESDDGGGTWGTPNIVFEVCGAAALQGSQLAVDSHGVLHIAFINLGSNFPFPPREIMAASFTPAGSVSASVKVSRFHPGGDDFFLQGEFRDFLGGITMNVDTSGTSTDGTLYLTWDDGRDKTVSDPLGTDGQYDFVDIMVAVSFDGGNTWFGPVKVNSDTQPRVGLGHDHYQPGVAVDRTGKVAVCWYDRRNDIENMAISHFCGVSTNQGSSFTNTQVPVAAFAPTHGIDLLINPVYMGDYDALTSDFTRANAGFVGSFQVQGNRGNPDVVAYSFQ